ncbi:hypothetical protein ACN42_g11662 [Penicillium freii]|uniref:Uncharacterized protein n=1 Tax=Penicillium freii TaxID=48697 RepID=A0A101M7U6_PENFR|nr:hypothetical protein ACN42_g11662 [Penicillium freii]
MGGISTFYNWFFMGEWSCFELCVEYQAWCMVGITKPIQTGKSMDRHDNGTIQNYIHCLIIDVRTDWKNNRLYHFS